MSLSQKNVLVTGSSRGIGKAIAFAFGQAGYRVILNAPKSMEELEAAYQEFKQAGISCHPILADVSRYEECIRLFQEAEAVFGEIDVLVNNAGISHIGLFSDMIPMQWQHIIEVNLYSVFHCTHIALPSMVRKHQGTILNISSMWGEVGASCEAVYAASKGGINSFTKSMAKELGPSQIRVNAISCGVIDTAMNASLSPEEKQALQDNISLMRFGKATDVANLAVFLADPKANYITGQIITIDGGMI